MILNDNNIWLYIAVASFGSSIALGLYFALIGGL